MQDLLTRVQTAQQQAREAGFDWPNAIDVIEKIQEELNELKEAVWQKDNRDIEDEFGDVLLATINLAIHLDIDLNHSVEKGLDKFTRRYNTMLEIIKSRQLDFQSLNLNQKEQFWQLAKQKSRQSE